MAVVDKQPALNKEQIQHYADNGFIILPNWLDPDQIRLFSQHCDEICLTDKSKAILEKNGDPYSIYLEQTEAVIAKFVRQSRLLLVANQLLTQSAYVHQIKLNHKVAMGGSEIMWHDDFTFWHQLDNLPNDHILTAAILLDDVNKHNSPLMLIPASHQRSFSR